MAKPGVAAKLLKGVPYNEKEFDFLRERGTS